MIMSPVVISKKKGAAETHKGYSMFAVVDGSNGSACAEFLKEYLFKFITDEPAFISDPSEAIRHAFKKADKAFLETVRAKTSRGTLPDRSGASVIVLIVAGDSCYLASLGNCRAVMSGGKGTHSFNLYREHTLNDVHEKKRVMKAGGNIQRSLYEHLKNIGVGTTQQPFRIYPGDLALTRAFGHFDAKAESCGANPKVILAQPDIRSFKVAEMHDFILIGSSGAFETLTNQEIQQNVWRSSLSSSDKVHNRLGTALSDVLQLAMTRESGENVSMLVVAFEGYVRQCSSLNTA
jgi:protein phosphatase 2C family protein 2/3